MKFIHATFGLVVCALVIFRLLCQVIPTEKRDPIWIEVRGTNVIIRNLPGIDEGYSQIIRINSQFRMGFNVHGSSLSCLWIGSKQPIPE